jgi:hypothetical protein
MDLDHLWLQLLRFVHLVGGVFWVGSMAVLAWFVLPTQAAEGADGGRFVQRMMTERGMSRWLNIVGVLTILSGVILYTRATMGTGGAFARSHAGMVFGFGGIMAVAAIGVGGAMGGASSRRIGVMRQQLAAERRGPTPDESAEFARLLARGAKGARITAVLLTIAATAMAVARYS